MVRQHVGHHRAALPVTATGILECARGLLLDFDGPVTALMPPPRNATAANRAREPLAGVSLPPVIAATTDHLAVLTYTGEHLPERLGDVEDACIAAEVAAAAISEPSPEIAAWWELADRQHIPVAIVSNNARAAVLVFLERHGWVDRVEVYSCRAPREPRLMKPNPYLISVAARRLGLSPTECTFIGDSTTDVVAGHLAGVPVIGFAKGPRRARALRAAGADAVMTRADLLN
jgi:beta-phosphoglucomutase-like phosphatase (HAD superfamily)